MPLSPTNKRLCLSTATILAVIVIDQIIKVYVKTHFLLHESVDVTPWFKLVFIENRGMAFGMDFIGTAVLTVFRIAAIIFFVAISWAVGLLFKEKKSDKTATYIATTETANRAKAKQNEGGEA